MGFGEALIVVGLVVLLLFAALLALEPFSTHTSNEILHLQSLSLVMQSCWLLMSAHDLGCCAGALVEVEIFEGALVGLKNGLSVGPSVLLRDGDLEASEVGFFVGRALEVSVHTPDWQVPEGTVLHGLPSGLYSKNREILALSGK